MKTIKMLSIILIVMVMVCFAFGCNKNGNDAKQDTEKMETVVTLEDPNFTILINADPPGDTMLESFKFFEEKYSGKATYVSAPMGAIQAKLIAMIAGGDSPDITYWMQSNMPKYVVNNILQPMNPYIDINDPVWDIPAMEEFKFAGNYYGVDFAISPQILYYNKTMFENNGLKTPIEYYKEGNWNWETFKEAAIKLTQDTNGDGAIDQWGYNSVHDWQFIISNGTDFVIIKEDGSAELNLKDPKLIEALQFYQDATYKHKYYKGTTPNQSKVEFQSAKIAMLPAVKAFITGEEFSQEMKDEWDLVPFPTGPNGQKGKSPAFAAYLGIPVGAKNPKAAAVWLKLFTQYRKETEEERLLGYVTKEQLALIHEIEKDIKIPHYQGILQKTINKLWTDLKKGVPVTTVIDTYTPIFQQAIDTYLESE